MKYFVATSSLINIQMYLLGCVYSLVFIWFYFCLCLVQIFSCMSFIIRAGLDRAFCLFRSSTGPAEGRIIGQSLLRRQGLKVKEEDPEGQLMHSQGEN